jgi:hypothetical protein
MDEQFRVTVKQSRWRAKNKVRQLAEAQAGSPIDFVTAVGLVTVLKV